MFVDTWHDKKKEIIHVAERVDGERILKEYPPKYILYYPDAKGKNKSIHNTNVSRVLVNNATSFQKERYVHNNKKLYESDYRPLNRCLEENYLGQDAPNLHVAFFDIEVAFDKEKGFAPPEDPFNNITAITTYLNWANVAITLVLKPNSMDQTTAEEICAKFENTILCDNEKQMLDMWLDVIADADILSGWNSEGFDIPYTVNRIIRIMNKRETARMCLWDCLPTKRIYEKYGKEHETYDTIGRVHLDYLELYRKYNYHEMHTYRLDFIGEYEIGETKVPYEGTLDQLYNNDFEKFIAYNRQDVFLLKKLDDKLKFIELTNLIAHSNTVGLRATLGAVAVTDQAIINEAHSLGMVVPDRKRTDKEENAAAGAYVAVPKLGLHEWIGSMDLNSLYPSIIRACNMSPETVIGQVRQTRSEAMIQEFIANGDTVANAWEGKFACLEYESIMDKEIGTTEIIDWEDGTSEEMSSAEVYNLIFVQNKTLAITANGTIFTNTVKGIIPGLLEKWYAERKALQAKLKQATTQEEIEFWDKRQLVKKINLNSAYGALLNAGSRFFDSRIGQSTTLTGRLIARHMASSVNECLTGIKDHMGDAVIYGDTDSVYFSAYPIFKDDIDSGKLDWSKEKIIELYDAISHQVNETFPGFMNSACNVTLSQGSIIRAGREVVASKGIYTAKKRYAVLIFDKEGVRKDTGGSTGELKAMGFEMRRADTPVFMQQFLEKILIKTLEGSTAASVVADIKEFREQFKGRPGWEKGSPKRVNNLTKYTNEYNDTGKCRVGHVLSAINWNRLKTAFSDRRSMDITDGQKIIVCRLKSNPYQLSSIAYPIDELNLPEWFKTLPFDHAAMEEKIIDSKVDNLLGVLKWDMTKSKNTSVVDDLFG